MDWFRFYDGVVDDPKVMKLPVKLRWEWAECLCIANRSTPRGSLPTVAELAFMLRTSDKDMARRISDLVKAGLIDEDATGFRMHGWDKRQYKSDNATERWRKHAANRKQTSGANVGANVGANGPEQIQSRAEQSESRSARTPAPISICPEVVPIRQETRHGDDLADWREAVNLLRSSLQTEPVAMEMDRNGDLAGVVSIEGWRWLYAARRMSAGNTPKSYNWLRATALKCKPEEFSGHGSAPEHSGRPAVRREPGPTNMPAEVDLSKYESESARLMALYEQQQAAKEQRRKGASA